MHGTCHKHIILFALFTVIMFGEDWKIWIGPLCSSFLPYFSFILLSLFKKQIKQSIWIGQFWNIAQRKKEIFYFCFSTKIEVHNLLVFASRSEKIRSCKMNTAWELYQYVMLLRYVQFLRIKQAVVIFCLGVFRPKMLFPCYKFPKTWVHFVGLCDLISSS